nr:Transposon Ty3-G Gag-Pol polyprotein [Ipomoea batatas]
MADNTTSEEVPIDDPITDLRNQLREQSLFQHQTTQVLQRSIQHLAQSIESLKLSVPHHLQPPNNNQSTSATLQNTPSAALPNEPIANTSKRHLPLKIDLPKFDGADPHGWIFLMQEFFDYHDISEEQRLSYVSFMVSGEASEWLRWMKNNNLLRSWPEFLDQVRLRFDSSHFEDFLGRLSKTCQATTVAAYRAEYEKLLNKVTNVPEVVLISMFVAGLKSTIRREVQRTKPTTLIQAFSLASEVEAQQGELRYLFQTHNHKKYLPRGPPQSQPHQNSHSNPNLPSPIIPLPSPVIHKKALPIVQISAVERQAKIARGECYTCDQKWSRSHRCPNRSLLLMCSEDDNSSDVLQPLDEIDEQVLTGDCSSLNSMAGPGTPRSLRLTGIIHNESLQVLIDGGSTHNFIQPQIAERLNIPIQAIPPFRVYIGNGDSLQCSQSCLDVPLSLQGHVFSVTLFILPIKGPDIVLGVQWLQDLGRVTHDYAGVSMEFMWQGVTIQLQGEQSPRLTQVSYSHLFALLESDDVHSCFELSPVPPEESTAISPIQWPNDTPTEILTILQQHAPVFELPRGLPPRRLFDHHVHLIPGSGPVNVRPYRYPHCQKSEIEKMVGDMLDTGIIRPKTNLLGRFPRAVQAWKRSMVLSRSDSLEPSNHLKLFPLIAIL